MIKKMTVAQCDLCGKTVPAKPIRGQYNEDDYTIPEGWSKGTNPGVHFCDACSSSILKGMMQDERNKTK